MKRFTTLLIILCLCVYAAWSVPRFSTAGFFPLPDTGREAFSMNPAWRFHKGAAEGAGQKDFDDSGWETVSLPDGIETLPTEASGCVNYQGEVWYRKHFTPEKSWEGKKLFLYFEAIMGKSKIWVNGILMKEHEGGYLPVIIDVSSALKSGEDNVIAVWTDNSDDPSYPPGKAQDVLDFTYCGGIYRDCWMIVHNPVYITDPNYENETAGGGLFVSFGQISEQSAQIRLDAHLRNQSGVPFSGRIEYELLDKEGKTVAHTGQPIRIGNGKAAAVTDRITLKQPELWSPDNPCLYRLHVYIKDKDGTVTDGYCQRVGIRSIEFKGKDGFWLNGKPYPEPLIGANRHQDFAVVGNALSNSLHWRDAKKLRDAGLKVIRNAHYPQDPAFMDACDELGLFVIVNTPGWQFWNDTPRFARLVYSDIRNMVRRDRNRPSVWLWEPILNETSYPSDFAEKASRIIKEEYPYPYCYAACDAIADGKEFFPVHFCHPVTGGDAGASETQAYAPGITYFTREWGDNVDDWNSHNSPSRASRAWGEIPMLVQAKGYARPDYTYTCYDALYRTTRQHVGGCLWHSFDHQRGYHPDPFYGGIMDAFRQPKYSYYMFCAQRSPYRNDKVPAETGPMVYIAHAMTPFSPADVTVYSNCEEVRLTCCQGGTVYTYHKPKEKEGMPSPVITFKDVFDVMRDKRLSRNGRQEESYLLAEGIMDGKVVATHKVMPSRRPSKILLWADSEGMEMKADGSDLMTVIAAVADHNGVIKRLNNYKIVFEIEGEGTLVGNAESFTNPCPVSWGTAPILVRSTTRPGEIRIKASVAWEGKQTPEPAELTIRTSKSDHGLIVGPDELNKPDRADGNSYKPIIQSQSEQERRIKELQKKMNRIKLREVEKQQGNFE